MNFTDEMRKNNLEIMTGVHFLNTVFAPTYDDQKKVERSYINSNIIFINSNRTRGIRSRTTGNWLLIKEEKKSIVGQIFEILRL